MQPARITNILRKSFPQYANVFFLFLPNLPIRTNIFTVFFRKKPKCSSGHVQCSSDNPVEKLLLDVGKFFVQSPKNY